MAEDTLAPNHHGDHPGFSGLRGLVAAIAFTRGRDGDAWPAADVDEVVAGSQLGKPHGAPRPSVPRWWPSTPRR